ncbi:preprotein translocase subunit SecE [Klenkia sp. PcliD-1-E]|uniref:preprotein translocase subunit SecE n=1 Tax=Klenkia sp. PcliD-1-E TaxID=2954492 RepID=UPI002097BA1A|nr:preprotein translocase subunit SecE [Klenkia sp. PcliD-1-E]MCO7220378.1 preprotein translocase subunit SecE [Klenkia sp. PcliD-1-E]
MSDEQPGTEDARRRPRSEPADDAELTDEQIDAETPGVDDAAELEAAEDEVAEEAAADEDKVVATPARRRRGAITADDDEDDEPAAPRVRRRDRPGGRPASEARTTRPGGRSAAAKKDETPTRAAAERARAEQLREKRSIGRFLREVVAELRKVIWPGRRELITYTTVVIVFVAFMVALVAGLDILFAQGVIAVFG